MAGPRGQGCPSCGASIRPLAATCEACGYGFGAIVDPDATTATDDHASTLESVDTGPCRRCGESVARAATYCPHCGASVREWRLVPIFLMIVGFCLTASIIGAIVGIPMQLLALRLFREAREGTVVTTETP